MKLVACGLLGGGVGGTTVVCGAEPNTILNYSFTRFQKDVKKQQGVARGEPFASIAEAADKHVQHLQ